MLENMSDDEESGEFQVVARGGATSTSGGAGDLSMEVASSSSETSGSGVPVDGEVEEELDFLKHQYGLGEYFLFHRENDEKKPDYQGGMLLYEGYLKVGLTFPLRRLTLSLLAMWRKSLVQLAGNSIRTLVVLEALSRIGHYSRLDADDIMHLFILKKLKGRFFLCRLPGTPQLFPLESKVRDGRLLEIVENAEKHLCEKGCQLPGKTDSGLLFAFVLLPLANVDFFLLFCSEI